MIDENPPPVLFWGLVVAVIGLVIMVKITGGEVARVREEADSVATELAIEHLEQIEGFEVRLSIAADNLADVVAAKDSAYAELVRELAGARAEIIATADLLAEATGSVHTDTVEVISTPNEPDSYRGRIDDGLLTADWVLAPPTFDLDYWLAIPQELTFADMADGRLLVVARALDPRVTLTVNELFYDPPEPVVVRRISWTQGGLAVLAGSILALVLK